MTARTDFPKFDAARYFPSLDGMRAFCVLLVMFNHVHAVVPKWIVGWLGVDVFFVLSGFLITTLLIREKARSGRISLKAFYTRRFFRIVPVYLFTVLLYAVAVRVTHDVVKTEQFNAALPWLLTFMQEFRPNTTGNILGHAWTLGIEEKFYVFWPLLLITLYPFRSRTLWWLAAVFITILLFPHTYARSYGGLFIGAVLAIVLSAPARGIFLKRLPLMPDTCLCLLVVGTYALSGYDYRFVLLFSAAIALMITSLVLRTGWLRKLLEAPALVYIGKRSYAIYLIHVLVLDAVAKIPSRFLPSHWFPVVAVAYLGCIAFASFMHVAIEQPCINVGRRLSKRIAEKYDERRRSRQEPRYPSIAVSQDEV
jgi:peptidoglycan/LPS O-acetylase OafA/YrhL